jgi:hypothetical protein
MSGRGKPAPRAEPPRRSEARAGLIFSVARIRKDFMARLPRGLQMRKDASVFLAAIVNYFVRELLDLSDGAVKRSNRVLRGPNRGKERATAAKSITNQHLFMALRADVALDLTFPGLVVPNTEYNADYGQRVVSGRLVSLDQQFQLLLLTRAKRAQQINVLLRDAPLQQARGR